MRFLIINYKSRDQFGISKLFLLYFIINRELIKVRYTLYKVLYDIRYIEIILNIMKLVLEKMFGMSRVCYIVGSLYQGLTVTSYGIIIPRRIWLII